MLRPYYSIGIVLRHLKNPGSKWKSGKRISHREGGWSATAQFHDGGHCNLESTQGELKTRYFGPLSQMVDLLIADMKTMGIEWRDPSLFYDNDGEGKEYPPPDGWEAIVIAEAARLGWTTPYKIPMNPGRKRLTING